MATHHLLLSLAAAALALAASPSQATMALGQNVTLNGAARADAGAITLTPGGTLFDRGSAFLTQAMVLTPNTSFEVYFSFHIAGGSQGADGMALVFNGSGPRFLGLPGGNLGFYPVGGADGKPLPFGPAYAVALDTHRNADYGDQGDNNVSFLDSASYQLRQTTAAPFDLNSGQERFAWVTYDGPTDILGVYLNDRPLRPAAPLLRDRIDLYDWLGPTLFTGFVAATGGQTNQHVVTGVQLAAVPEPSTWAMLLAGFVGCAGMARHRLQAVAA